MRVTHGMVATTTLRNIQRNLARSEELQDQITSASRLRRPSDDPIGVARALNFQEGLDLAGQHLKNIDQATAWLNVTDAALDGVGNVLHRARELAVRGGNGTTSAQDRAAIAAEVRQLAEQALTLANTKYESRYVFAGTASTAPAYEWDAGTGTYAFRGNHAEVLREISPNVTLGISVDGSAAFDPVFSALAKLTTALDADDAAAVGATLDDFETALDAVLTARAQVGARTNRLELTKTRLEDVQVNLTTLLSNVKDVDMAEAMMNFSVQETVYKASLQAAAQALQPSLLDYLR